MDVCLIIYLVAIAIWITYYLSNIAYNIKILVEELRDIKKILRDKEQTVYVNDRTGEVVKVIKH